MRAACGMHAAEALLAFQGLVTPSGMSLLSFGPVERQARSEVTTTSAYRTFLF